MNRWKKLACGLLAAALAALAGCNRGDTSWVYRSGGLQPPAGVYLIALVSAADNAENKLAEAAGDDYESPAYKDLLTRTLEDQPVSEWMAADAQRQMREYFAVEQKYAEYGLALSDSEKAGVQNTADNSWQYYGEFYERNGVAQSSLQLQMENAAKRTGLFLHLYGRGGELEIPEQELRDTFQAEYAKVGYMLIAKADEEMTGEDGTTYTIEQLNAAFQEKAEGYVKRLQEGEALEDLIYEQEQEEAGENAADVVKPEPDTRVLILGDSMKGTYYSDELVEGAKALEAGKAGLVEDSNFYYILRRMDILENPDDLETFRDDLISSLKADEYKEKIAEWGKAVELEANQRALEQYKPSRLKMEG